MMHLIKNPIIFGVIAGVLLCLFLFLHDKFLTKKPEDKAGVSVYVKIFLAGFVITGSLAFLIYNRDISFKNPSAPSSVDKIVKDVIQDAGAVPSAAAVCAVDEATSGSVKQAAESLKPSRHSSKHGSSKSSSGKAGYTDTPDM